VRIDIVTLFPEMIAGYFDAGVLRAAREQGLLEILLHNLRDYAEGPHRQVDDRPYGGGPGMVLKPEPFFRAVEAIKREMIVEPWVILLSARGRLFHQDRAHELASRDALILLAGRYQGIDERVNKLASEELSIGDYVLSGGELAAAVVAEAVGRLVPGALGNVDSPFQDSFSGEYEGLLGPPLYTRPEEFRGDRVPDVLLSGDHAAIARYRREQAIEKTRQNRQELLKER
jgi:tRNA (guanine37-N1)-methyltransferase